MTTNLYIGAEETQNMSMRLRRDIQLHVAQVDMMARKSRNVVMARYRRSLIAVASPGLPCVDRADLSLLNGARAHRNLA